MKSMLKKILPALVVASMLAIVPCYAHKGTEVTMEVTGSGIVWAASSTGGSSGGRVEIPLPQALYDLLPQGFEAETPFTVTLGNYTLHVESDQPALVEFERVIEGDANCDGRVNKADLSVVVEAFAAWVWMPRYNGYADFNIDGFVDIRDVTVVCRIIYG